jgi:hypothetical protein
MTTWGTGVQAVFSYDAFTTMFPEFLATVSEPQALAYWNMATLYHRNDGGGPVTTVSEQASLLNMLTAHIAALLAPDAEGNPASPIVGRLTSFSEGSAGGAADYRGTQAASWYTQTKYGTLYWEAMSAQRTAFYTPGRRRFFGYGQRFPFVQPW